jgi:hypothetical protein
LTDAQLAERAGFPGNPEETMPARTPSLSLLAALLLALLAAACGGQGFSSYCDELNGRAWKLADAQGCVSLVLRFDGTSQSCGAGCSCQVSPWTYEKSTVHGVFGIYDDERCVAQLSCALPGSELHIELSTNGAALEGDFDESQGNQTVCSGQLSVVATNN